MKFHEIVNLKEDGGLEKHVLKFQIKSVIDGLTLQISGREAGIDKDLEKLRLMKQML